jgi:hypothetical protein
MPNIHYDGPDVATVTLRDRTYWIERAGPTPVLLRAPVDDAGRTVWEETEEVDPDEPGYAETLAAARRWV